MKNKEVDREYKRLFKLFESADETKRKVLDGLIIEAARTKVQLDELFEIAAESGIVMCDKKDKTVQKKLPVGGEIVKLRATYTNIIDKLCKHLGSVKIEEDELGIYE